MPNRPHASDYDLDTTDGQVEYLEALEKWESSIGNYTDQHACPVGKYSIKNDDLIIGSLNMGRITLVSDNEFTLDYKKNLDTKDDYIRSIYTYTRIYSLTL